MTGLYIIAEAGSNHCGEVELAEELVEVAAESGADAVKFQFFRLDEVWDDPTSRPAFTQAKPGLIRYAQQEAEKRGLDFLCTPFSPKGVEFLRPLVDGWKLASGNTGLMDLLLDDDLPIYFSTGFLPPTEVRELPPSVVPLHCIPTYPAMPSSYAIREWLMDAGYPKRWGISDHTPGMGTAACAVGQGASVVEKHFKLHSQPVSPDSGENAINPLQLSQFVSLLREVQEARDGMMLAIPLPSGRKLHLWKGMG